MIFKYKGLDGLNKRLIIPDTAYKIELDWIEGFGVALCWKELRDPCHKIIASTAKQSDLVHFELELMDQIIEVDTIVNDKIRCDTCGSIENFDNKLDEIIFMEKARKKCGPHIKREELVAVCDNCIEYEKNLPIYPYRFRSFNSNNDVQR